MTGMRWVIVTIICLVIASAAGDDASTAEIGKKISRAMADRNGVFVLIDCSTGAVIQSDGDFSQRPLPPCSTFKIWSALIGLEEKKIRHPEEAFFSWDGVQRRIPSWNQDLSLKQAFQVSCVPGFQQLVRSIGEDAMTRWLKIFDYGDQNISAGLDVFWLPADGRKPILITPTAQAELLCRLTSGELPVSADSMKTLRELMRIEEFPHGELFGKTGSGTWDGTDLGWFIGFVESSGKRYVFVCALHEPGAAGVKARALTESILRKILAQPENSTTDLPATDS